MCGSGIYDDGGMFTATASHHAWATHFVSRNVAITSKFCDKNQRLRKQRNRPTLSAMCFVNSVLWASLGADFSYLGKGTSDLNSDVSGSQACVKGMALTFLARKDCYVIVMLVKSSCGQAIINS